MFITTILFVLSKHLSILLDISLFIEPYMCILENIRIAAQQKKVSIKER